MRRISTEVGPQLFQQLLCIAQTFQLKVHQPGSLPLGQILSLLPKLFHLCYYLLYWNNFFQCTILRLNNQIESQASFLDSALQDISMKKTRRPRKPWEQLGRSGKYHRRRKVKKLLRQASSLVGQQTKEIVQCLNKEKVGELVDIIGQDFIDKRTKQLILSEIRASIPLDLVVRWKDSLSISDRGYGALFKFAPLLRKIMPLPYHTVSRRHQMDEYLHTFDPQETQDGISIDPSIVINLSYLRGAVSSFDRGISTTQCSVH